MITIDFNFRNRRAEDLVQLNAILATMKLEDLQLVHNAGYMSATTDREDNLIGYRYGLDAGKLICKLARGKRGYCYQIDSVVVDESVDHDVFLDIWRKSNLDRTLRIVIQSEFDGVSGYLIVHHQKV